MQNTSKLRHSLLIDGGDVDLRLARQMQMGQTDMIFAKCFTPAVFPKY